MDQIPQILTTLLAAYVLGYLLRSAGVSGGMMLGGIMGAAVYNLVSQNAYMPYTAKFISQLIAGGFLGASLTRENIKNLPRLILPIILVIGGFLLSDFVIGFLIVRVSPLDGLTALVSGIAGGINDIPLIGDEMGADAGKVAVLQFVRLTAGIGLFPSAIRYLTKTESGPSVEKRSRKRKSEKLVLTPQVYTTIGVAVAGGLVGKWLDIPAGVLIFSMVATSTLRLTTGIGNMPGSIKQVAQLLAGAYIGCMLDRRDILELKYLILPALTLVAVYAINCLISGYIVSKFTRFSMKEALLMTTPAGAGEIALISSELDVSQKYAADIMVIHISRVIAVVTLFPQVIPFLVRFL